MDTDAIEKAAEAIARTRFDRVISDLAGDGAVSFDMPPDTAKADIIQRHIPEAQAAYTAIIGDKVLVDREPSEQMLHDGYKASYTPVPAIRATWTAMLNASEGG